MHTLIDRLHTAAIGLMFAALAGAVPPALAQDANQVLERGNTFLTNLARFGLLAFGVFGVFLAGTAMLEINRLRQTQEPLGRPVTKLLIGAALTSLSVIIAIISGTFGTESNTQSELSIG